MQIYESCRRLDRASIIASQTSHKFVEAVVEKTLQDWGLGDIQSKGRNGGRGPQGASIRKEGVSVLVCSACTRCAEREVYRVSRF